MVGVEVGVGVGVVVVNKIPARRVNRATIFQAPQGCDLGEVHNDGLTRKDFPVAESPRKQ